jgi:putative membrane protein
MPTHDFGPGFRDGIERGFDGGFHWFGIVPLLLFAVLIVVIVWAVIRLTREGGALVGAGATGGTMGAPMPVARPDGALEELRLRYARGEMSREDYAQRLADLGGDPAVRGPATASPEIPSDGA